MGYSTEFKGVLKFTKQPMTGGIRALLDGILGRDIRKFDPSISVGFCYVDLQFTKDMLGLEWDGCEKTYDMLGIVNYIIRRAREIDPEFGLTGELLAQGERIEDRWILRMIDGFATRVDDKPTGERVTCPRCEEDFFLDGQLSIDRFAMSMKKDLGHYPLILHCYFYKYFSQQVMIVEADAFDGVKDSEVTIVDTGLTQARVDFSELEWNT